MVVRRLTQKLGLVTLVSVSIALLAWAGPAQGVIAKSLGNGGFERPRDSAPVTRYQAGQRLGAWMVSSGNVDHVMSSMWQPSKGSFSLEMNGDKDGAITQTVATIAGRKYRLHFSMAGDPSGGPAGKKLAVKWNSSQIATPSFNTTGKSFTDMGWVCRTYTVSAVGSTSSLGFTSLMGGGSFGPAIDSVRLQLGGGPAVDRAVPRKLAQGVSNEQVSIFGSSFAQNVTVAFSGTGITVLSVIPVGPSEVVANVSIDAAAALGPRDVTVTNSNGQSDTCPSMFTVDARPVLTSLSPNSGARGSMNLAVALSGTGFQPGARVVFLGGGITVKSVMFTDSQNMTATIDIAPSAGTGLRDVKLTNPDRGSSTCTGCFSVT